MKKIVNLITFFLIVLIIFSVFSSLYMYSYAAGFDWSSQVTSFDSATGNSSANTATQNIMGAFAVVAKTAGVGISVIMLIIIGAKYMISAPGDRADIKKHAVVYVVGAVVLFGATQIIGLIADFAANNLS